MCVPVTVVGWKRQQHLSVLKDAQPLATGHVPVGQDGAAGFSFPNVYKMTVSHESSVLGSPNPLLTVFIDSL